VVPLSTISHWQREFESWTDLNTIVYHGTYEDRRIIREMEFAYESDCPARQLGANQAYLKQCAKLSGSANPNWMVQVVITTPEILVAEDWKELTAVKWEVLVVDEAHRLKNHNSKLALNLRTDTFSFKHKILLTGTPIQVSNSLWIARIQP
jgi:SNF2 family DNA or RNA helicase